MSARSSGTVLVFVPVLVLAGAGCRRACGGPSMLAVDAAADASVATDGGVASSRCHPLGKDVVLGAGADAVIGEALVDGTSAYIGLLRRADGGRVASVAIVPLDLSTPARFVDLGPARGDDPAPHPFFLAGEPHVAFYAAHDLAIARVQDATIRLRVPQPNDESLAFDVASSGAGALLAWDDDDAIVAEAIDVSQPRAPVDGGSRIAEIARGVDADLLAPRVTPRAAGGYWALWIERRPEPEEDGAPDPLEGAGEVRSYSFVAGAPLDEHGARVGDVVRMTPAHGHVSALDVAAAPGSLAAATWLVVTSSEEEREGEGGELLFGTLGATKLDGPLTPLLGSAGRGSPDIVPLASGGAGAGRGWIAHVDAHEQARLLPVGGADPRPSPEPWLDGGRLLAALPNAALLALIAKAPEGPERPKSAEEAPAEPALRRVACN